MNGKRGRRDRRPRLASKNTVLKKLEEGHIKSIRPRSSYMKRLMTVDEAKEVCRDRSVWRRRLLREAKVN